MKRMMNGRGRITSVNTSDAGHLARCTRPRARRQATRTIVLIAVSRSLSLSEVSPASHGCVEKWAAGGCPCGTALFMKYGVEVRREHSPRVYMIIPKRATEVEVSRSSISLIEPKLMQPTAKECMQVESQDFFLRERLIQGVHIMYCPSRKASREAQRIDCLLNEPYTRWQLRITLGNAHPAKVWILRYAASY